MKFSISRKELENLQRLLKEIDQWEAMKKDVDIGIRGAIRIFGNTGSGDNSVSASYNLTQQNPTTCNKDVTALVTEKVKEICDGVLKILRSHLPVEVLSDEE